MDEIKQVRQLILEKNYKKLNEIWNKISNETKQEISNQILNLPYEIKRDIEIEIYYEAENIFLDIFGRDFKSPTVFIDGKAIVNLESADTANLKFKTYVYDIQWTKADNSVTTLIPASKFVVTEEVTYE